MLRRSPPADPNPSLASPTILSTALSDDVLQEGNNSDVIEIGPKQNIVLRVLEHEEPRPKTLDDVREDIVDTLKNERAAEQLDTSIAEVRALIENAEDPTEKVAELGGTYNTDQELDRSATDLDRSALEVLFALPKPDGDKSVLDEVVLPNGDRLLMVLKEVAVPPLEEPDAPASEENADAEEVDPAIPPDTDRAPQFGNNDFTAMLRSLRASAKVEINEQALSQ